MFQICSYSVHIILKRNFFEDEYSELFFFKLEYVMKVLGFALIENILTCNDMI